MKSPAPEIYVPWQVFETHPGKCPGMGPRASSWKRAGHGHSGQSSLGKGQAPRLQRAGQGKPSTKPTPDVPFGMNHTAHFQLPACVLCKC